MLPNFDIFGKTFSYYMIMTLIGIGAVSLLMIKRTKKLGIDENDMLVAMLIGGAGAVFGAHILYGITNFSTLIWFFQNLNLIKSFDDFVNIAVSIFGGAVFYGGLLGGTLAIYIYVKKIKGDKALYARAIVPVAPLFHFFGRIGCFLSGCCYGVESSVGFVYYHSPLEVANNVTRFPIQLVESALNLLLFLLLLKLEKKEFWKNKIIYVYFIIYPIIRFVDEFWRGDDIRGFIFGMSTSQFISILIFITAVPLFILQVKKEKNQTQE